MFSGKRNNCAKYQLDPRLCVGEITCTNIFTVSYVKTKNKKKHYLLFCGTLAAAINLNVKIEKETISCAIGLEPVFVLL